MSLSGVMRFHIGTKEAELSFRRSGAVALAVTALGCGGAVGQVATPEAKRFNVSIDEADELGRGVVLALPGTNQRVGIVVLCERESRQLTALLFFGAFPPAKPVQAAVRTATGEVERFGGVLETEHGALSGFHAPELTERADVLRLIDSAFTTGALVSNGHNAIWNRIGRDENAAARQALLECAGMD